MKPMFVPPPHPLHMSPTVWTSQPDVCVALSPPLCLCLKRCKAYAGEKAHGLCFIYRLQNWRWFHSVRWGRWTHTHTVKLWIKDIRSAYTHTYSHKTTMDIALVSKGSKIQAFNSRHRGKASLRASVLENWTVCCWHSKQSNKGLICRDADTEVTTRMLRGETLLEWRLAPRTWGMASDRGRVYGTRTGG